MCIKDLENNRFLFQFFHELDISRVLEGSPWTFNQIPLLLERLTEGDNPRLLPINLLDVWVQVYGLKSGFKSDRVLEGCGNFIGHFLHSCPKNYLCFCKEYLRL